MNCKDRGIQYDYLKVITTVLVVIGHITRMYTNDGIIMPAVRSEFLDFLTKIIYSFHMPLFICLSGLVYSMCLNELGKYKNINTFIKKKACRLLIPYFVFGIFYVMPIMIILGFSKLSYARYIFINILLGVDARHLWFLYTLFFIFLLFRIFRKYIEKVNPILMITILTICSLLSNKMPLYFQINNIMFYSLFFYLGYIFNNKYGSISDRCSKTINIIILILIQFIIYVINISFNIPILNIVSAIIGILLMIGLIRKLKINLTNYALYRIIKNEQMGIYLFHPMIIYILFYYLGNFKIFPLLLALIILIITFILSIIFSKILRKIHLKIILGE